MYAQSVWYNKSYTLHYQPLNHGNIEHYANYRDQIYYLYHAESPRFYLFQNSPEPPPPLDI